MGRARPTIRCLWEDLVGGLQSGGPLEAQLREARTRRQLPHPSFRLDELLHPVMDDVRGFFTEEFAQHLDGGGAVPSARAFSLGQSRSGRSWGMVWYKARSDAGNQHLRGLVCRVRGTFWLSWEGDRNTEYSGFNVRKEADQHTRHFEPTDDDFDRLALEDAWAEVVAEDQLIANTVAGAVLDAWAADSPINVELGGQAEISVEANDHDGLAEVEMVVTLGHAAQVEKLYVQLSRALPGVNPDDWEPQFDGLPTGFTMFSVLEGAFVEQLVRTREEHGLPALVADPKLAADPSDERSHLVSGDDHVRGYTEGALIRSVCGHRFVPSADPDEREVCGECAVIVHALGIGLS